MKPVINNKRLLKTPYNVQLSNTVVHDPWGKEIIKMEIRKYFKLNYYEIKHIKKYLIQLKLFLEGNM